MASTTLFDHNHTVRFMDASDLSRDDHEFLSAIDKINANPDGYPGTEESAVPANSAAINQATSLDTDQINYRMGGRNNGRGFNDAGVIDSYKPTTHHGPRSAELTELGQQLLSEAQERTDQISGVDRREFEELEEKVRYLELVMKAIQQQLNSSNDESTVSVTKPEIEK